MALATKGRLMWLQDRQQRQSWSGAKAILQFTHTFYFPKRKKTENWNRNYEPGNTGMSLSFITSFFDETSS